MNNIWLFLFFQYLIIKIYSETCINYDHNYVCSTGESEFSTEIKNIKFQTPPKTDTSGNYKDSYQDMSTLVGYTQLKYSSNKKSCTLKVITFVNPKITNSKLLYKFGDKEQESNEFTVTDSNSYPKGLNILVRLVDTSNNEIAKLKLEEEYFIWDNPIVTQSSKYNKGQKGIIIELFGWTYDDVREECNFLGVAGYLGVKVYPPHESIESYDTTENGILNPWTNMYQPVSYKLNSRMGTRTQLKNMINKCRANNVRVYTSVVINHMVKNGKDMYKDHVGTDCSHWGGGSSTGGSPFWTVAGRNSNNQFSEKSPVLEFPGVPYFMEHFHCKKDVTSTELNKGWLDDYIDLNTENDYVRQRISDYFTELYSIGFSGFGIYFAEYISPNDYVEIFKKLKVNLGNDNLPDDLFIYLEFESNSNSIICGTDAYSYGSKFTEYLQGGGLSNNDIKKIKIFINSDIFPACSGSEIEKERYILGFGSKDNQINTKNSILTKIREGNITYEDNIKIIFSSYATSDNIDGFSDGKSDCNKCTSLSCKNSCTKSYPYKKAYKLESPSKRTIRNLAEVGVQYSSVYRNIDIINEMRTNMNMFTLDENELLNAVIDRAGPTDTCEQKCSLCNAKSKKQKACIACNTNKGYYPLINNQYQIFYECVNPSISMEGFYFNSINNQYQPCYESCKTCHQEGDPYNHNCDLCDKDLIKRPGDDPANNCVTNCSNYFYYVDFHGYGYTGNLHQYKCTTEKNCVPGVPYFIKDKRKCIEDCKNDDTYRYLYSGYCLKECPPNTYPDNFICKDVETDDCVLSDNSLEHIGFKENSDETSVEVLSKNYANEYDYTNNHLSQFHNLKYNVIFTKNKDCVNGIKGIRLEIELDFNVSLPQIDFGKCYDMVKEHYGIEGDLIVAYVQNNDLKKPYWTYAFFDPSTGEKLKAATICAEEKIIVKENISNILSGMPNYEAMMDLLEQGINIFDIQDPFYQDLCFPYDPPVKKDITLSDRLLIYYPNITLCDPGCSNTGINFTDYSAICECKFNDIVNNEAITNNAIMDELTGDILEKVGESNLEVLKCVKNGFKYFKRSIGGIIFIILLLIIIVMAIIYFLFEVFTIMKYVYNITQSYLSYLGVNNKELPGAPPHKNNIKNSKKLTDVKSEKNPHKNLFYKEFDLQNRRKRLDNEEKHKSFVLFEKNNINEINSNELINPSMNALVKPEKSSQISGVKNITKKNSNDKNVDIFKTEGNEMIETKNLDLQKEEGGNEKTDENGINFKEYLAIPYEDMDYDDAVKLDRRGYCEFFADRLMEKILILDTFFAKEPLKPMTIKIIVFILTILCYFVINGLFYNEEYISKLFHLEKDDFFDFIPRSIKRFIYTLIVCELVQYITEFFFIEEKRIQGIFRRERDNIFVLKKEIILVIKQIKKRNISFIIVVIIIFILFFIYVLCFNYVYRYTQTEWIKSSIAIFIANELLALILAFIETSLRYLAFACKSERVYQISQLFD